MQVHWTDAVTRFRDKLKDAELPHILVEETNLGRTINVYVAYDDAGGTASWLLMELGTHERVNHNIKGLKLRWHDTDEFKPIPFAGPRYAAITAALRAFKRENGEQYGIKSITEPPGKKEHIFIGYKKLDYCYLLADKWVFLPFH